MMDPKMLAELNQQIMEETYSAYIYHAMAADLEHKGYKGMATWKVELWAIEKPPSTWDGPLEVFKAAYAHEQHITGRINHMVKVARELNDNAAYNMLQWFVEEQVEEEANTSEAVQQIEIAGGNSHALLMLDREMGIRVFAVPASAPYYPKPGQATGP